MEVPAPSSEQVSARMSRQARTGTAPERALRRELHARGLRYRVHYPFRLAGLTRRRCDVAFTRWRIAVFVDGCFRHGCPLHATSPKANGQWWSEKLTKNVERDRDTDRRLQAAGWTVLRFWEHESSGAAAAQVEEAVQAAARRDRAVSRPS